MTSLSGLAGVIWISQAMHDFDLMTTQGQSFFAFLKVTLLTLPLMAAIIAPLAMFIALITTLIKINNDSELVVISASGVSPARLMRSVFMMAFAVALLSYGLTLWAVPQSAQAWRTMITEIRSDFITKIVKAGKFNKLEKNLVFHYRERSGDALLGIFIQDSRDENLVISYIAERGRIIPGHDGNYLVLENGSVQRDTSRDQDASIVAFQRYALDLSQLTSSNGEIVYRPHERLTSDLLGEYLNGQATKADKIRIASELSDRFSSPLYAFPFAAIGFAALNRARTTRQRAIGGVLIAIASAAVIRIGGFVLAVGLKATSVLLPMSITYPLAVTVIVSIGLFLWGRNNRVIRLPLPIDLMRGIPFGRRG